VKGDSLGDRAHVGYFGEVLYVEEGMFTIERSWSNDVHARMRKSWRLERSRTIADNTVTPLLMLEALLG
jgi:hypothetical protein